jgi:hypothetical protein
VTAACHVDVPRCERWAPTPRSVVAVPLVVSLGGALSPAPPWQVSQAIVVDTSTTPSMCRAGSVMCMLSPGVMVGWHAPQLGSAGWLPPGGMPWHDVHWLWVPSTRVQVGLDAVPRDAAGSVPPWQ